MSSTASMACHSAGELIINLWPDDCVFYEGTAAQLIDEGLVPEDFNWPRGRASKEWEANGFDCWLQRKRPAGHKGPMRTWLDADNWLLRVTVSGRDNSWSRARKLDRQAKELEAERYRLTADGQREWRASWQRTLAAIRDPAYQRFKLLVPGLVPPKRGRKPRAAHQGGVSSP